MGHEESLIKQPILNYTLIYLGDDCYDLIPEPTRLRFAKLEDAKKFMENLASSGASVSYGATTNNKSKRDEEKKYA